jgi:arylsulfatase A-like enzyme
MRTRSSLHALAAAAILLAALAAPGCGRQEPARPLNLLVILVDTLRADHLGYHGYDRDTSPTIDALAARSQVFLQHQSTASRTGPATASIFTGLFPQSHGVINPLTRFDAKGTLAEDQTTLAELLAARGYACYGYTANINASDRFGFGQGFVEHLYVESSKASDLRRHALKILAGPHEQPFYLYLHYMEPHSSYAAPAEYRELWVDPRYDGRVDGRHQQLNQIVEGTFPLHERGAQHLRDLYDQEIRYTDDEIALILQALAEQGLAENTLVVFIADHGEEFLDHGSVLHGYTLYQEQLHVPFFVHDPRREEPRRIEVITRHTDVMPTLLALLGVDHDLPLQGESLVPLIDGEVATRGEVPVLAEASLMAVKTVRQRSLRLGDWKLIEHLVPELPPELYHLAEDPAEQRDLLAARPGQAQRLRVRLAEMLASLPVAEGAITTLSEDEVRKLRSLGYVK